jgi:hypothetical protein
LEAGYHLIRAACHSCGGGLDNTFKKHGFRPGSSRDGSAFGRVASSAMSSMWHCTLNFIALHKNDTMWGLEVAARRGIPLK